jgi:ABC-type phosphate transport system substrate-binding protein
LGREYAATSGDRLNYQSIGSGGGVRQVIAHTVDFGATDKPLKPEELARSGLVQFPPRLVAWCRCSICRASGRGNCG